MVKHICIVVLFSFPILFGCAQQNVYDYEGNWVGTLPDRHSFNFTVTLEALEADVYHLVIANKKVLLDTKLHSTGKDHIQLNIDNQLYFDLYQDCNGQALNGFIKSGRYFYSVQLREVAPNTFEGPWNSFMFNDGILSDDFLLYVENNNNAQLVAYPIFGDQRFRGTWASGFKRKNDTLFFKDDNTGFKFRASLSPMGIGLEIYLVDALITNIDLTHSEENLEFQTDPIVNSQSTAAPPQLTDGWETADGRDFGLNDAELQRLIDDVLENKLVNTHSILIAKQGKLVFETYFDGFNTDIPHDLRSASKSISSAMIGIAIDDGIIEGVDAKLYDCIPETYQYTKDATKSKIRIKDLLTMSSGLDVNDLASEDYYQNPDNPNSWLQTVLEAPMVKEPGTYADYGSANPFLLGVCLSDRLEKPLESYMHEKLFVPLGITNYINQTDDTEVTPYFGGGMMLTPRDLLKFGQLYLDKGIWNGKRILSEKWMVESFKKHMQLQDVVDKNDYGYLWWHDVYKVAGKKIETVEARGAGGQFIFVIPELESVVVITSGNFRNRKGNQPRDILKEYLLPAMVF
ncbi:serine hydrolase [Flavobacteriaceae bacterium TP-CH-4]|uniref:Serine hydrolase n=1 Tax=Pelagihabitans pacificus TaxID=2696054 RepID=A0A967AP77_9FLAO|nr:serine hydrolase [Pelagihabitans pacificus]NHF57824.1 serine hydrolase [Pelagihabitans pacificus]